MDELVSFIRTRAHEHRYTWSWDIIEHWTDDQIRAAIAGAKTRRGAITKAWNALVKPYHTTRHHYETVVRFGVAPRKPVSLFQYLAAAGGIAPHAELAAILDGPQWVGGHGPLVRRTGMTLDDARASAVAGGYLHDTAWEGGVATSTINELLDALADEARGRKCYPHGEAGEEPDAYTDDDPANYAEESFDEVSF